MGGAAVNSGAVLRGLTKGRYWGEVVNRGVRAQGQQWGGGGGGITNLFQHGKEQAEKVNIC